MVPPGLQYVMCEDPAPRLGRPVLDEIEALPLARQHKLLTAIEAKRIRRLGREKAVGWPSPQYEGSALFSPQGKTSLRNTVIKPFQSKAVAGSTSPVALWV